MEDDPMGGDTYTDLARTALDGLVLSTVHFGDALSGAAVQRRINDRHGIDISPGAIYPRLQALADDGHLCARQTPTETVYAIEDYEKAESVFFELALSHLKLAEVYVDACEAEHETFDMDSLYRRLYAHVTDGNGGEAGSAEADDD